MADAEPIEVNRTLNKPGAADRLRALQWRFRALGAGWIAPFWFYRHWWRRIMHWIVPAAVGVGVGIAALGFYDLAERFGSSELALRHLLATPSCAAAHEQGLAPARRGEAGYWRSLDADDDGVACERWR